MPTKKVSMVLSESQFDYELIHSLYGCSTVSWNSVLTNLHGSGIQYADFDEIIASVKRCVMAGKVAFTWVKIQVPKAISEDETAYEFGIELTETGRADAEKYRAPTASYPKAE